MSHQTILPFHFKGNIKLGIIGWTEKRFSGYRASHKFGISVLLISLDFDFNYRSWTAFYQATKNHLNLWLILTRVTSLGRSEITALLIPSHPIRQCSALWKSVADGSGLVYPFCMLRYKYHCGRSVMYLLDNLEVYMISHSFLLKVLGNQVVFIGNMNLVILKCRGNHVNFSGRWP
jgi:hypothetical protein